MYFCPDFNFLFIRIKVNGIKNRAREFIIYFGGIKVKGKLVVEITMIKYVL